MILKGKKIYLKKGFSDKEYATLLTWFHDLDFVAYLSFAKEALSLKNINEIKEFENNLDSTRYKAIYWGIYTNNTDKLIGYTFVARADNGECEFGIGIGDKDYWGKGIGFEATKSTVDYLFNQLKLKKINLCTSEYNLRAINTYKKIGFKIIKKIPNDREVYHNGKWIKSATVWMEITK